MASVPPNPTQLTPPRVAFIDERSGAISREWYRFFLSLLTATQSNQQETVLAPDANSLLATYDAMLAELSNLVESAPDDGSAIASLEADVNALEQTVLTQPRAELGTMSALQQADLPWVTFNNSPSPVPTAVGSVYWDGGTTLGVQATASVLIRVGEAEYVYAKASSAITKGQLCYHTGAVGASGVITAAPTPLNLADPNQIVGVAAETIALNGFGLIQISGDLRGFNTTGSSVGETWADGDPLYYNPAYVGSMTKTKPSAPNQKSYIGEVTNAGSGGSGSMHVRIVPGSVLGGTDSNVQFGALTNGDLIQYDSTLQYWKNVAPSTITIGTATNLAGGAANRIAYQTGVNTTGFIVAPTIANTYLEWSGSAFQWSANPLGTVTSVSVVSANGLAGTVATATTTPAITLSTTVTGVVKGNGTALSAAIAGTDYVAPGAITTSGLTMATARLLGRTTASTGAVEEITVGTGLSLSGGSLSNSAPDQTVSLTGGTGISISGSYPSFTITNTAPDQIVSLTGAGTTVVTGTYPSFTITSNDQYVGTVTSVSGTGSVNGITLTGTVTSSGSLTLGGTLSNVSLTSQVTGTLPIANGGTGSTSTTYCNLTTNVTGTLPVGNGGTGATTFTANALLKGNTTSAVSASNVSDNGSTVSIGSGIGFSIARTTVTSPAAADGNVFSGTYTPTSFNTTNIAASTPQSAQYLRVGNTVTVSGQIDIDPTATGFALLGLSLPIASAITSAVQLSGVFNCPDADGGGVYGDATNDRATFQFTASSAANLTYYYTFTYRVL